MATELETTNSQGSQELMVRCIMENSEGKFEMILPLCRTEYAFDTDGKDIAKAWYDSLPQSYDCSYYGEDDELNSMVQSQLPPYLEELTGKDIKPSYRIAGFYISYYRNFCWDFEYIYCSNGIVLLETTNIPEASKTFLFNAVVSPQSGNRYVNHFTFEKVEVEKPRKHVDEEALEVILRKQKEYIDSKAGGDSCECEGVTWGEIDEGDPFNGYDYVDMGDAGIWATCNIGASKPEEAGLYFRYADTEGSSTDTGYDISKTPYWVSGTLLSKIIWSKYTNTVDNAVNGIPDNKTVLDPEDDAAHVIMGGKWRIPTIEEFQKLFDNCTGKEETLNGIHGIRFTLKTDSSKSIFIPYTDKEYPNKYGYYHSSSLYDNNDRGQNGYSGQNYSELFGTDPTSGSKNHVSRATFMSVRGIISPSNLNSKNYNKDFLQAESYDDAKVALEEVYEVNPDAIVIVEETGKEKIIEHGKELNFVPSGGADGQVLSLENNKPVWKDPESSGGCECDYIPMTDDEVDDIFVDKPEKNQFWYTSTDGEKLSPLGLVGYPVKSHEWDANLKQFVVTLDGDYTLTTLYNESFWGKTKLKTITLPKDTIKSIAPDCFRGCSSLIEFDLTPFASVTNDAFLTNGTLQQCGSITHIDITPVEPIAIQGGQPRGYKIFEMCGKGLLHVKCSKSIWPIFNTYVQGGSYLRSQLKSLYITGDELIDDLNSTKGTPAIIDNINPELKVYVKDELLEQYNSTYSDTQFANHFYALSTAPAWPPVQS